MHLKGGTLVGDFLLSNGENRSDIGFGNLGSVHGVDTGLYPLLETVEETLEDVVLVFETLLEIIRPVCYLKIFDYFFKVRKRTLLNFVKHGTVQSLAWAFISSTQTLCSVQEHCLTVWPASCDLEMMSNPELAT